MGHPDKINSQRRHFDKHQQRYSTEELKREFQELQSTWDRYEDLTKNMKVTSGDGTAANFTQFGVGCSFSGNEEEKALRNEITDQACRGWFSSGLVSSGV